LCNKGQDQKRLIFHDASPESVKAARSGWQASLIERRLNALAGSGKAVGQLLYCRLASLGLIAATTGFNLNSSVGTIQNPRKPISRAGFKGFSSTAPQFPLGDWVATEIPP